MAGSEPLLTPVDENGSIAWCSPFACVRLSRLNGGRECFSKWMSITSEPNFLWQSVHRQNRGRVLLALAVVGFLFCIVESVQPNNEVSFWVWMEWLFVLLAYIGTICISRFHCHALLEDVLVCATSLCVLEVNNFANQHKSQLFRSVDQVSLCLMAFSILSSVGVHTLVQFAYVAIIVACMDLGGGPAVIVDMILIMAIMLINHGMTHYHLAAAFCQQLQAQEKQEMAMQARFDCIQAQEKAMLSQQVYSEALSHLKTPLVLARSELESCPILVGDCHELALAKYRINQLWDILVKAGESHTEVPVSRSKPTCLHKSHRRTVTVPTVWESSKSTSTLAPMAATSGLPSADCPLSQDPSTLIYPRHGANAGSNTAHPLHTIVSDIEKKVQLEPHARYNSIASAAMRSTSDMATEVELDIGSTLDEDDTHTNRRYQAQVFDAISSCSDPSLVYSSTLASMAGTIPNSLGRTAKQDESTQTFWPSVQVASVGVQSSGLPPRIPSTRRQDPLHQYDARTARRSRVASRKLKVLPTFHTTPPTTIEYSLREIMLQTNAKAIGCCRWHIVLTEILKVGKTMLSSTCPDSFTIFSDWQCGVCKTMNEFDTDVPISSSVCCACGVSYNVDPLPHAVCSDTSNDANTS